MSTEEVQTNSPNVLSSSQVVRELTTFYFYHQIQNKIELNFFFQIFCSRRSLKATQSNLKSVVNQGQLAFALQEVVKLVKHILSRPRHTFHHNSYRKELQIGDDKTPRRQEVTFLYSTCCECFCFSCQSIYSCVNYLLSF